MKHNDVFRWSWKVPHQPYWCRSQIAIFANGRLFDTFWGHTFSDKAVLDQSMINLHFLVNLDDCRRVDEHVEPYYAPEDFFNLNHANQMRGNCYLRNGVKLNRDRMKERAVQLLEKRRCEAEYVARDIVRLTEALSAIDTVSDEDLERISL